MRPQAKEGPQLPEAGKGKEGSAPLELPEETSLGNTLILAS